MYTKSYSKKIKNFNIEKLWRVWTNINDWSSWQSDIEYAELKTTFKQGEYFILKPKGGPRVKIQLIEVIEGKSFTDCTQFPFAKMYGRHDFIIQNDEIEIKTTMSIHGSLSFLWKKLVYNDIVKKLPEQTEALIKKSIAD